jgi:hypothetical protein
LLLLAANFLVVFWGLKEFHLWSQVEYLHAVNLEINFRNLYSHVHTLRYTVVYPIYYFAETLSMDANKLFSYVMVFLCFIIAKLISDSVFVIIIKGNKLIIQYIVYAVFILLSLFMNGRLMFGFLAYSLLIYGALLIYNESSKWDLLLGCLYLTLSLWLSSVTSGILISLFILLYSFVVSYFVINRFIRRKRNRALFMCYFFILFVFYTPLILKMVNKNLDFYGGGLSGAVKMSEHGSIGIMNNIDQELKAQKNQSLGGLNILSSRIKIMLFEGLRIFMLSVVLYALYLYRRKLKENLDLLYVLFCFSLLLILSIFGYSILMMSVVPFTIILAKLILDKGEVKLGR